MNIFCGVNVEEKAIGFTVVQLKEALSKRGLSGTGNKSVLQERLIQVFFASFQILFQE